MLFNASNYAGIILADLEAKPDENEIIKVVEDYKLGKLSLIFAMESDNNRDLLQRLGITLSNYSLNAKLGNVNLNKAIFLQQFPESYIKNAYIPDGTQLPFLGIKPSYNITGHLIVLGDSSCIDDSYYDGVRCDELFESILKYYQE